MIKNVTRSILTISLLVCQLFCVCLSLAQVPESGYYRIISKSNRSNKNALSVSGNTIVGVVANSSDVNQLWKVTKVTGTTNGFTFQSVGNGNYIQPQSTIYASYTTASTPKTLYVRRNANYTDVVYNISNVNAFTGTTCLHESNGGVVPWSINDTSGGTEWSFVEAQAEEVQIDELLPTTGFYRIQSGGRGTAATQYWLGCKDSKALATTQSEDMSHVWILTHEGYSEAGKVGVYTLRNANTLQYVQDVKTNTQITLANTQTTVYIKRNSYTANEKNYFNISTDPSFGGKCVHAANQPFDAPDNVKVIGWYPNGAYENSHATEWTFLPDGEMTVDSIRNNYSRVSGVTTVADGKIYRIINNLYDVAITESPSAHTLTGNARSNDGMQYWKAVKTGSGYALQNVATQQYVKRQNGARSVQYVTTTAASNLFTFNLNRNFDIQYLYDIVDASGVGLHCDQYRKIVGWNISTTGTDNAASLWSLQEVSLTDQQVDSIRQDYRANADIVNNADAYRALLPTFFDNNVCTVLKEEYRQMTDEQLTAALQSLPPALRTMALKIKNDSWAPWEKHFRIYDYHAFSDPAYWATRLRMTQFGQLNNPTGIIAKNKGDVIFVFVDEIPAEAKKMELLTNEIHENGYQTTPNYTSAVTLKVGLNIVQAHQDNTQFYLNYVARDNAEISTLPKVRVHIEGGEVCGYFNLNDFATAAEVDTAWLQMRRAGLFANAPILDVMAAHTQHHVASEPALAYLQKDANLKLGTHGTPRMAAERVDQVATWELQTLGLTAAPDFAFDGVTPLTAEQKAAFEDLYPRRFNNYHMLIRGANGANPYSGGYATSYPGDYTLDLSAIANTDMWVFGHEIGHAHQGAYVLAGTMEVSNNNLSNVVCYSFGQCCTRYYNYQTMRKYTDKGMSWLNIVGSLNKENPESFDVGDIGVASRMYFGLWLYYHALGNDPVFYPKVFRYLRGETFTYPNGQTVTGVPLSGYGNSAARGSDDYLRFAQACARAAGENLNPYFEYWGFYRKNPECTRDGYLEYQHVIGDYANSTITTTQAEVDAVKSELDSYGTPNYAVIFPEDRLDKRYAGSTLFANVTSDKAPNSSGDSWSGVTSDVGSIATFLAKNELGSGHCSVSRYNVVNIYGYAGAVGFLVFDQRDSLLYVSANKKFTMPATVTQYRIMAVCADNTLVEIKTNIELETGISEVPDDGSASTRHQGVYDLRGRRLGDASVVASLSSGIYVIDGRKVVVR